MSEELDQVSYCVHEGNTGLSIWWVDDCFTNERVAEDKLGGFLPIEAVKGKQVDPSVHGYSGYNYNMLLKIAEEGNVSFYVCSFEYAETNWGKMLNKPTNLLLIDIGYEGKPEEQTYGIDFYLRMVERERLVARLVFLTVDIVRIDAWITKHTDELSCMKNLPLSLPLALAKMKENDNGIPMPPEKKVKAFVQVLKNLQKTTATELEFGIWKALRKKALEICNELAITENIHHPFWAHHLPFGGNAWSDRNRIESLTDSLRHGLNSVFPVMKLPRYCWKSKYGWQHPPIRALSQFDSGGKDLSVIFRMVQKKAAKIPNFSDLNMVFLSGYTLTHDYLWFNICALAQGLYNLAESFAHEVKKWKNNKSLDWKGCISWSISEITEKERLGLHVLIYQTFIAWNEKDEKHPYLLIEPYSLPHNSSAQKSVLSAYDSFRRAGVNFNIESDGSFKGWIPAKEIEIDNTLVWELDES